MNIRITLVAWLLLLAMTQLGCVALNVPSQRYHDPVDGGGIFGGWTSSSPTVQSHQASIYHPGSDIIDEGCLGGSLEVDPFDSDSSTDGNPKPPEVPWPRFHPVPTRPVFGNPEL